ncbi:FAS1 domain-containing protein [Ramicandelaber brevisporus]|nr:FAS1 domain-containing protein [Ramicandelaber brevisporus]
MRVGTIAAAVAAFACAVAVADSDPKKSILDNAKSLDELKTLGTLIAMPQVDSTLKMIDGSNATALALLPSNGAFNGAAANLLSFASDPAAVQNMMAYHLIQTTKKQPLKEHNGKLHFVNTALQGSSVANLPNDAGQVVGISKAKDGTWQIHDGSLDKPPAKVIKADVESSNGYIQVIDRFLEVPRDLNQTLALYNDTAIMYSVLSKLNLTAQALAFKGLTVFVPSNDAFSMVDTTKLNETVLTTLVMDHVIPGQVVYSTQLTDGMTVPPRAGGSISGSSKPAHAHSNAHHARHKGHEVMKQNAEAAAAAASASPSASSSAAANPAPSSAPSESNNAASDKDGAGYYKVKVMSDGTIMVGDAKVIRTDLLTKNGVVHVIDKVLVRDKSLLINGGGGSGSGPSSSAAKSSNIMPVAVAVLIAGFAAARNFA